MVRVGLIAMTSGCFLLATIPLAFGIGGYILPIVVVTAGYALFQAANNTTIMTGILPTQRGVIAGMLSLSRNLGLITGASVMGALFARATAAVDVTTAPPGAIALGMRITFFVASSLILVAIAMTQRSRVMSPQAMTEAA